MFNNITDCENATLSCYGYGDCALQGDLYGCDCVQFYDAATNCRTDYFYTYKGAEYAYIYIGYVAWGFLICCFLYEFIRDIQLVGCMKPAVVLKWGGFGMTVLRFLDCVFWHRATLGDDQYYEFRVAVAVVFNIGSTSGIIGFLGVILLWLELLAKTNCMDEIVIKRARIVAICALVIYAPVTIILGVIETFSANSATLSLVNSLITMLYLILGICWSLYHIIRMRKLVSEMSKGKVRTVISRKNAFLAATDVSLLCVIIIGIIEIITDARYKIILYYAVYVIQRAAELVAAYLFFGCIESHMTKLLQQISEQTTQQTTSKDSSEHGKKSQNMINNGTTPELQNVDIPANE